MGTNLVRTAGDRFRHDSASIIVTPNNAVPSDRVLCARSGTGAYAPIVPPSNRQVDHALFRQISHDDGGILFSDSALLERDGKHALAGNGARKDQAAACFRVEPVNHQAAREPRNAISAGPTRNDGNADRLVNDLDVTVLVEHGQHGRYRGGMAILPLIPEQLRWRVPEHVLAFNSTADIKPLEAFIGQDQAIEALRRGVAIESSGFNVFAVGMLSSGRLGTLHRILTELRPVRRGARDLVYVKNFVESARPLVLQFPAGRGLSFRKELVRVAGMLVEEVPRILQGDDVRRARERQHQAAEVAQHSAMARLDSHARELGFVLGTLNDEDSGLPVPLWVESEGDEEEDEEAKVHSRAELQVLVEGGNLELEGSLEDILHHFDELEAELAAALNLSRRTMLDALRAVNEAEQAAVRVGTEGLFKELARRWPAARQWILELHEELVGSPEWFDEQEPDHEALFSAFGVNVIHVGRRSRKAPLIVVANPTWQQLIGGIEGDPGSVDHRSLRGGAVLDADGGYLVLNAADMLQEQGVWKVLKRMLTFGDLDIANPDSPNVGPVVLRPDSIRPDVKVVLVGDPITYATLYYGDPDFKNLFKIKAEFEDDAPVTPALLEAYARFCARIVRREGLPHVSRRAVVAVLEWAVRESGRGGRITTYMGHLSDLLREAAYESGGAMVELRHVLGALSHRRLRDNLAERRTLELLERGVIRVDTRGETVGQINGLVVYHVGGHDFGRPLRITATAGVGRAGIVSIEREAGLSGRAHDKGIQILGGFLRGRLGKTRTIAIHATICFEQSYGKVDGDSASIAEMVALLSALAEVPIRQSLAITGSFNQFGEVQSIGAVNEKIEGFYACCRIQGLTPDQGVLIPAHNVPDLCLGAEVGAATEDGTFRIWAIAHVDEAIELLTGLPVADVFARAAETLDRYQDVARLQGRPMKREG